MRSNANRNQSAQSRGLPVNRAQPFGYGLLLVLAALILVIQPAVACSCAPPPPPEEALSSSAAVFTGKVTHIRPLRTQNRLEVTLRVYQSWEGEAKSEITILDSWVGVILIGISLGILYVLLMLIRSRILRLTSRQKLPADTKEMKDS